MLDDKFDYLLRLGDTALVLSHRLSEWVGKGPALEEDMALANTALDLIGQARLWLDYAGEVEGAGRDEDKLAYGRDAHQYRNLLLVERPNGSYADTRMRQYLFDSWHSCCDRISALSPWRSRYSIFASMTGLTGS
jgi:ring-1,2-phenylacetyl-CoA epoxidase subunit PaaC